MKTNGPTLPHIEESVYFGIKQQTVDLVML